MTDVSKLSPEAMRALYEFIHAPGLQAHPGRLQQLLDGDDADGDDPALQQLILARLQLGDATEFDPGDLLHRTALLPREELRQVARRIGLACAAPRLRLVIRRSELELLDEAMRDDDWDFILAQPPSPECAGKHALAKTALAELPEACQRFGWSLLESRCDALPPDIGERLRLKLPPASRTPSPGAASLSDAVFTALCEAAGKDCNPGWDAAWSP